MNICCFSGKIIEKIKYDFVYNSKRHNSIVNFKMKIQNGYETNEETIINVRAYDTDADYIYRKLEEQDQISIIGWIKEDGTVTITEIERMNQWKNTLIRRQNSRFFE